MGYVQQIICAYVMRLLNNCEMYPHHLTDQVILPTSL
jgi:hypothetical protein